jgi:hypothetical protein
MDIVFLVIAAVISGAEGWEAIETFGEERTHSYGLFPMPDARCEDIP